MGTPGASEQPTFNLDEMSLGSVIALGDLMDTLAHARDGDPAAGAKVMQAFKGLRAVLAEVVRDVPRAWLTARAPAEIDWTDPESFNWLRRDKILPILVALNTTTSPESVSKNSDAP